jgi:eukaryotic-like serine/threonine-protein kinase
MSAKESYILPADVILVPVSKLSPGARERIEYDDGDFAISRPRSRAGTRIIDARGATLLQRFRQSRPIVEAIIAHSREERADPEQLLDDALPLLEQMVDLGFLVIAGSPEAAAIEPALKPGTRVGEFETIACVQALRDSELHQARDNTDRWAALKIARPGHESLRSQLDREAAVLARLSGTSAPALFGAGDHDGRPYLLIEWCGGVNASIAAADLRSPRTGDMQRLIALCANIASAYAALHARGVVHGDVHEHNVLVSADESVRLIDFGISRMLDSASRAPSRGGVGWYYEPEYARARLARRRLPPASPEGEQYILAALLYRLFTGHNYLDFSYDKTRAMQQIARDAPLAFTRHGLAPMRELEAAFGRALSKEPADRYPSVQAFAEALGATRVPANNGDVAPPVLTRSGMMTRLAETWVESLTPSGALFEAGIVTAPACSVHSGAAGVAYALYRMSLVRDDPRLLAAADVWATRAAADSALPGAFLESDFLGTTAGAPCVALYHRMTGVHCVRTLIALAMGDMASAQRALEAFVEEGGAAAPERDVTMGRAGILLACSLLLDALPASQHLDPVPLLALGDRVHAELWRELDGLPPIAVCEEERALGIAHGWAGFCYAIMRWSQSRRLALPETLRDRLQQLADLGEQAGRGVRWPRLSHKRQAGSSHYMSGWCNGGAGHVHLWTLAHQMLGDREYETLAERAAWNTWESEKDGLIADICCGAAGRAYALLAFHRHSGDRDWLLRAMEAADSAVANVDPSDPDAHSLFKGSVGVAVLAAELERPEMARMPLFEHEGWPEVDA